VTALREFSRPMTALYVGGMGAKGKNFYNELMVRYASREAAIHPGPLPHVAKRRRARGGDNHARVLGTTTLCGPAVIRKGARRRAFREPASLAGASTHRHPLGGQTSASPHRGCQGDWLKGPARARGCERRGQTRCEPRVVPCVGVAPASSQKVPRCTSLEDAAVVDDDDAVGPLSRRQTMRDENRPNGPRGVDRGPAR